ncbi:NAD(P)-dependent oxidoreductase [Arthrobacter agilis]|uniref:NAD(P)-dependent oxidoreductase n=1 Tax=Arthrobacter agilis TaxID=37921 RepID=UPI00277D1D85|nr:NAD(P)-dependent oxidoreductase [Arthrobacter agilis]MDQ0733672.1 3-hydroxyisobutyrate dehydrogenase-like beta-hydroxyacid dehydrogenase [Arthrobacter agilis]
MSKVAYLGLGTMGRGMSANLATAGHEVTVWNRTPRDIAELTDMGVRWEPDLGRALAGADYVMYCLSDDRAVRDVVLAAGGVAERADSGSVVIDLSTIDPETSAEEAAAFAARGIRFLDAPVFGSKGEAAAGGLWIVAGGDRTVFDQALDVLKPISETVHYMGAGGNGARMKLVGNLAVAAQLEALGESLTLASKAGLDLRDVLGVFAVTDFRSPIFDGVGSAVLEGDYSPSFALKLMLKDALLVRTFAERLGAPVPGTEATLGTIRKAVDAGWGEENASALIKVLAAEAGTDLAPPR